MRAIEINTKNDDTEEEELWLKSISANPAFDFLQDPNENIYSNDDNSQNFNKKEVGFGNPDFEN